MRRPFGCDQDLLQRSMAESLNHESSEPLRKGVLTTRDGITGGSPDDAAHAWFCRGETARAFWVLQQGRACFGTRNRAGELRPEFSLQDVAAALPEHAVYVSVLAGRQGGAALAIKAGCTQVHSLSLPQFTIDAIRVLIGRGSKRQANDTSLNGGYRRFHRRLGRQRRLQAEAWLDWDRTLESVLAALGAMGWNRLHRWLIDTLGTPRGSEVVLSLPTPLASLPVAAVLESNSGRYFIDDFAVRRVPDAAWLIRCARSATQAEQEAPALLAVLDPGGDLSCDPQWPTRYWRAGQAHCEVLAGERATPSRVLECLPACTHYVHFGHGRRQRRRSILELAGGTGADGGRPELDDAQVRAMKFTHNRLSILAACESGLVNDERGNELKGMAGSFLSAGSACVIGCLWPVESGATRRLVEEILRRYFGTTPGGRRLSPAQALRQAQIELRDSTMPAGCEEEVGSVLHLRPGCVRVSAAGAACARQLYYWAAFSCLGA